MLVTSLICLFGNLIYLQNKELEESAIKRRLEIEKNKKENLLIQKEFDLLSLKIDSLMK